MTNKIIISLIILILSACTYQEADLSTDDLFLKIKKNVREYIDRNNELLKYYRSKNPGYEQRIENLNFKITTLNRFLNNFHKDNIASQTITYKGVLIPWAYPFRIENPHVTKSGPFYHVVSTECGYDRAYEKCFKWSEFKFYIIGHDNFSTFVHLIDAKEMKPFPKRWIQENMKSWTQSDTYIWFKEEN